MQALNLPSYPCKIKRSGQNSQIFDPIRRKYVRLSPEEWVRQHFINFLIRVKHVPPNLLAVEMQLDLNGLTKRCDLVVYSRNMKPILLVECKAPEVSITQDTFDQIARYNLVLDVALLSVTNGLSHFYCTMDHRKKSYRFIEDLPLYEALSGNTY